MDTSNQHLRQQPPFMPVSAERLAKLHKDLMSDSQVNLNYLALIVGSCTIATLGLLSNSTAVIIGAMIIAPLMSPIRGLAFAALDGEVRLLRTGFFYPVRYALQRGALRPAWLGIGPPGTG